MGMDDLIKHDEYKAKKMAGEVNTHSKGIVGMKVYNCASFKVCPGDDMDFSLEFYDSPPVSVKDVRPPHPMADSCMGVRKDIACAKCGQGYYGRKTCNECGEAGSLFTILFLLVFPPAIVFGYTRAQSAQGVRIRSAFVLVSTFNMVGFFAQTLAVFGSFTFEWPAAMDMLFSIARIFLLDLQGLSFACAWNQHWESFEMQYTAVVLLPCIILMLIFGTMGFTNLL